MSFPNLGIPELFILGALCCLVTGAVPAVIVLLARRAKNKRPS
ncbi:MAG: hypothetical protein ACM3MF_07785 [Anaerolineae bacterium]